LGRHERIPRGIAGSPLVFEPGAATILGISDLGDEFWLVRNEVDVVAPDEPLPSFRSPGRARSPSGHGDVGGVVDRSRWSAWHHIVLSAAVD
jgi:L-arabinose isomerase